MSLTIHLNSRHQREPTCRVDCDTRQYQSKLEFKPNLKQRFGHDWY